MESFDKDKIFFSIYQVCFAFLVCQLFIISSVIHLKHVTKRWLTNSFFQLEIVAIVGSWLSISLPRFGAHPHCPFYNWNVDYVWCLLHSRTCSESEVGGSFQVLENSFSFKLACCVVYY